MQSYMSTKLHPHRRVRVCIAAPASPHGVDALGLLREGVGVAAGRGAKINGDHHHEGRARRHLVRVALLQRERAGTEKVFFERTQ
ncbi:hypothetical protein EYF80_044142 [Liparis tanakae]|uniref:Uncharacterized protein n=1 Tax=Liparis tanakae TaxID=230148 RepID=A0A4Z2FYL4_9TELE|nr:hypothetical protein EYF80_044142 [Liparis tanakae]